MALSGDDKMTLTTAEELVPALQESDNLRAFNELAFLHQLERVITMIEKPYTDLDRTDWRKRKNTDLLICA